MKQLGILILGLYACLVIALFGASVHIVWHGAEPYASVMGALTTWGLPLAVVFAATCVLAQPSRRGVVALHVLSMLAIAGAVLWPVYALAQDASSTTINAGGLFSDARGTIETVAGVVVAAILGWISLLVKKNLGLSIDGKMRDTLQGAAMNGVHLGLDKVQSYADTRNFDVKSKIIADGIGYIRQYAPQAVKHFGLGEEDLAAIVKAKLAQLQPAEGTAVAKATGA